MFRSGICNPMGKEGVEWRLFADCMEDFVGGEAEGVLGEEL